MAAAGDAAPVTHRLYSDLAQWWPVLSPPEDYADEAADLLRVFQAARGTVTSLLELGSGGGNNAVHLARRVPHLTLVDRSEPMLAVSRRLNPGAEHVAADMLTVRLGRRFDAVLVHDAVDYLLDVAELDSLLATVDAHLAPDGVVLLVPDHTRETYVAGRASGGSDAPDGRSARYFEWTYDPDPDDTTIVTEYLYVLREPGADTEVVHERHVTGLFPRRVWLDALERAGFSAAAVTERTDDDREPREYFVGRRELP